MPLATKYRGLRGIEVLIEARDPTALDGRDDTGRQRELLVLEASAQNMLLHEAARSRLAADLGVFQPLDIADHPLQHREILLDALRDVVIVMPDLGFGRVDIANRFDIAGFDRMKKFVRGL